MDEQSIWKKEISFRRKPKAEEASPEPGEQPTSIWKKDISRRRKAKPEVVEANEPKVDASAADDEAAPKQSIWKKEIGFGRKTKKEKSQVEPVAAEPEVAADSDDHVQVSDTETGPEEPVWQRAVSFSRKAEEGHPADPVAAESEVAADSFDHVQVPGTETGPEEPVIEPVAAESEVAADPDRHVRVSDTETGPDEPGWQRAVSFSRKAEEGHPAEPIAAESEVTVDSCDHVPVPGTETGPEEPVWKPAVSFSRKAEEEQPAAEPVAAESEVAADPDDHVQVSDTETGPEEPIAIEPVAAESELAADPSDHVPVSDTETGPEEAVWKREVSFSRKAEEEQPATESPAVEPVAAEPEVATDPDDHVQVSDTQTGPEEPVWKREVSFSRKPDTTEEEPGPVEEQPPPTEPVAAQPAPAEPWSAPPVMPPAAIDDAPTATLPAQEPAPVVHPPVPAAELPPLPGEKTPFWKKDISLGGKKREKRVKVAKADRVPKVKEPKQPKAPKIREPRAKRERGGGKGAKRLVGLKIGASQLAAARVANNGSAELLQVAREPLEAGIVVGGELRDPDALAAALKEFFTKHKLPKRGVRLGIANNRIGVRTFEIVGIHDPKQLANAIRFRAQEALPIPIDEAVLDYHVLGERVDDEGQPVRRILLVVAYRELIDRYVDACKRAGIGLVGIDLEAFALLRAIQAPQDGVGNDPSAALVAVAIGHERSTFAVSDGRVCEFTRVLEWGGSALNVALARVLNAAPSEVEGAKRTLSLADSSTVPHGLNAEQGQSAVEAVRRSIQTFARELVSSLQYYQNQPGSLGIGEIVLTGGTAHLPGLASELERLIGVRVRVGDPLARMKVSKKVGEPEQVGSLAVAIGLGIED